MNVVEQILQEIDQEISTQRKVSADDVGSHGWRIYMLTANRMKEIVCGHMDGESVNVSANGSWIPVEERLPEPNKKVLATILHHKWISDYDSAWVPENEKVVHEAWVETSEVVYVPDDGFLYNDSECEFTSCYAYIKPEPDMSRPVDEVVAWLPMPEPYQAEGRKK